MNYRKGKLAKQNENYQKDWADVEWHKSRAKTINSRRFNRRREYSSLATASARQSSTCYGRDGTIASRSINWENNIEALVIFRKIQFALGLPNRYEFYSGAKKKWAAVEKVNKNMYHISSIKSENQEVFWTFHVAVMQINGKEMYKKVCCN